MYKWKKRIRIRKFFRLLTISDYLFILYLMFMNIYIYLVPMNYLMRKKYSSKLTSSKSTFQQVILII